MSNNKGAPKTYHEFKARFQKLAEAWDLTPDASASGPLDQRTQLLVKPSAQCAKARCTPRSARRFSPGSTPHRSSRRSRSRLAPSGSRPRSPSGPGSATSSSRSHPAELEAGCVGHAARVPRRIPHDFDAHLPDPREALDLAPDVLPEDVPHSAARSGHGHVDLDAVALGKRHGFAAINEAEVHEIDRDLRIEHRLQLLPDPL